MKHYLILLLLLTGLSSIAQKTKWLKSLGGAELDEGFECTISANGDLLFCGTLMDTTQVDGVSIETIGQDFFVAKTDTNGTLQWIITGGGPGNGSCYAYALAADASNNVYLGGKFSCNMQIDGTEYTVNSEGTNDAFILKADSDGNIKWVKTYTGTANEMIERMDVDENGIAVTVRYVGSITIGDQTFSSDYPGISGSASNAAILSFNSSGELQWGLKLNGSSSFSRDIKIGSTGDIFFTCEVKMSGTTSPFITPVGGTTITPIGNPLGNADIYLCRVNRSAGTVTWINRIGSESSEMSYNIDLDASDNCYCGALYQGEIQLTSQSADMKKVAAAGSGFDMIVFKYTSDGNLVWSDAQGADETEGIYDIAVNDNGYVYVSAYMLSGGTVINNDSLKVETGNGAESILMSYTTDGTLNWYLNSKTYYNEDGTDKSLCRLWGMAMDEKNRLFLTGTYIGQGTLFDTAQFDNSGTKKNIFYALFDPEDVEVVPDNEDTNSVYNPVAQNIQIWYSNNHIYFNTENQGEVSIYNTFGQLYQSQQYNGKPVDVATLPNGIYIVRFITDNAETVTQKIFKN